MDVGEAGRIIHNQTQAMFKIKHEYLKVYPDLKWVGQLAYSEGFEPLGDSQVGTIWKTPKGEMCFTTEQKVWDAYYEATRTLTDAAKTTGKDLHVEVRD